MAEITSRYTPDVWIVEADAKIGYGISFTRHFYQSPQHRSLGPIRADIFRQEQETEDLLTEIPTDATLWAVPAGCNSRLIR